MNMPTKKVCPTCGQEKSHQAFAYTAHGGVGGTTYGRVCSDCREKNKFKEATGSQVGGLKTNPKQAKLFSNPPARTMATSSAAPTLKRR